MCKYVLKVLQYWICNGKEAKLFYFSTWPIPHTRAKQDTLRGYQAFYSKHNAFIEMKMTLHLTWQILYKREKERFVVLATFWKNDNSSCFWYTNSFNWKSNFVLIYYKSEDGYPNFLFSYLLLIALYTYSTYIIWLKKYSVVFYFSKFLTRDYFLFFVSSSSIADSGTVWLDTYIKIIVIWRDIHRSLRKL